MFDYIGEAVRGPGAFRFIVQPFLAVVLGVRDGLRDTEAGRAPYLFHLLTGSGQRKEILREGAAQIAAPLCIGFLLDVIVRFSTGFGFHPLASAIVGMTLVGLPYIAARSIAGRAAGARERRRKQHHDRRGAPGGGAS